MSVGTWIDVGFVLVVCVVYLVLCGRDARRAWRLAETLPADRPVDEGAWTLDLLLQALVMNVIPWVGLFVALRVLTPADYWSMGHGLVPRPGIALKLLVGYVISAGGFCLRPLKGLRRYRTLLSDLPVAPVGPVCCAAPFCHPDAFPLDLTGALLVTPEEVRRVPIPPGTSGSIPVEEIAATRVSWTWRGLVGAMGTLAIETTDGEVSTCRVARAREVQDAIEQARLGDADEGTG